MGAPQHKIAVLGLGYVGLPLAVAFAAKYPTVGYDISERRIAEISSGTDLTRETTAEELKRVLKTNPDSGSTGLYVTADPAVLDSCNTFIVTVPTPIDESKKPNLQPLIAASETIAKRLKKNDIVIYESTTFPGCTEEICVPVLEKLSGLCFNTDFTVGYSPERVNPGDKINTLTKIQKVTSGSTPEAAEIIDELYGSIITVGTYRAPSIKVAEAAKAIENAQRDINISFVNELAIIFEKLGIDTQDVLETAATKWNFLKYKPGLVGGHCIGVDPYYLAYKAEQAGYIPNVILSGRRVNDQMGIFIASKVVKLMIGKGISINRSRTLILGLTFKENCPDTRNTKIVDIYREMTEFGSDVTVLDPWADPAEAKIRYNIDLLNNLRAVEEMEFDAVILAVAHDVFKNLDLKTIPKTVSVVYDCKSVLDKSEVDARL